MTTNLLSLKNFNHDGGMSEINFHNKNVNNNPAYHTITGVMVENVTKDINNEDDENVNDN